MPVVISYAFLDSDIAIGKEDAWVDDDDLRNYEKKLQELRVQNIDKSTSDLQTLPQVLATVPSNVSHPINHFMLL